MGREPTRKNAFRIVGKALLISIPISIVIAIIYHSSFLPFHEVVESIIAPFVVYCWFLFFLPLLALFALVAPRAFYSEPTIICNSCDQVQPPEEFLNLMEKELVGTTNSTKTMSSARPVVGATIGQGGPGLALGGYTSTSNVPIQLGRFQAIGVCPGCENRGKCTFETEVQIWTDPEGRETTEIVGDVQIPEFGIIR